jgi:hypothetical protein
MILDFFKSKAKIQGLSALTVTSQSVQNLEFYSKNVETIYQGYINQLEYGSSGIQNVINYRRSWIIGNDTTVHSTDKAVQEFIDNFNLVNNKNLLFTQLATYGEIEGKVFTVLFVERVNGEVVIRPRIMPYIQYGYTTVRNQFNEIIAVKYMYNNNNQDVLPDRFVFANLSLITHYHNSDVTPPNVAFVVKDIIAADKAMANWRDINDRSAKTTPIFEVEDWVDAQRIASIIKGKTEDTSNPAETGKKWKVGEGLAIKGKAAKLEFNSSGIESLKMEIISRAQKISGHSGIPIFLLGFPELMSNRATASETVESIRNKTMTERLVWQEKIKEMYQKSIILYNKATGSALNWKDVKVTLPVTSQSETNNLVQYWEPLVTNGIVSKRTYREKLPDVDPDLEEQRILEEKNANMENFQNNVKGFLG